MEQRKKARVSAEEYLKRVSRRNRGYISVGDKKSGQTIGHLVDFSTDGVKIIGATQLVEAEVYCLGAIFPSGRVDSILISFDVQCKWCQPCEGGDLYESGCQFHHIDEDDLNTLLSLLGNKKGKVGD
jgi:hypothetical protein